MKNRYIGIENELISFEKDNQISFSDEFSKLKKVFNKYYEISSTSIRTDTGNGFYVDGSELEILTPPVAINKGFSTRLTDSLIIGRNKVLEATPKLKHTGYSMHWNVSNGVDAGSFYKDIAIPFHLFGLTPLSTGLNLREKDRVRLELLGDSINNEDQINALALLLGSYSIASGQGNRFPWRVNELHMGENKFKLLLPNGRYDFVSGNFGKNGEEIQAQQYLEAFYHWLQPTIEGLGTKKEIQNLKAFVQGDKKLEFDKFKYFAHVYDENKKNKGVYLPLNLEEEATILKKVDKNNLPLEAKLLGEIVTKKNKSIENFGWRSLQLNNQVIVGIKEIYKYAESLNERLPKFKNSSIRKNGVNNIEDFKLNSPIEYNVENDYFKEFKDLKQEDSKNKLRKVGIFLNDVRKSCGRTFMNSFIRDDNWKGAGVRTG